MKKVKILALPVLALMLLASCTSVRVLSDYDKEANFNAYKSYAFYKTGIDKAHISDLDKKRILKAIESEMSTRGFVKSENPDILVSIFTKEKDQVDVYSNNYGWGWGGWGWGGWGWGGLAGALVFGGRIIRAQCFHKNRRFIVHRPYRCQEQRIGLAGQRYRHFGEHEKYRKERGANS